MKKLKDFLKRSLPGIISGGADNDPAGIATYSASGAQFGYGQLWVMVIATPMLIAVQAMCARLGDVQRRGLMAIIKDYFPRWVTVLSVIILVIANTASIGADLAGMSEVIELVSGIPYIVWVVPITFIIWYIIVFQNYKTIEKYFALLSLFFFCYIVSGLLARPDWASVLKGLLIPHITFSPQFFAMILGIMGTTITPFLFFWQSRVEIEEHKSKAELTRVARKEDTLVAPGFIYSNIISIFIMIAASAVLFGSNTAILSASDAARALEPLAGGSASLLFAIGIIGSGLLAVPILATSTAYVVAEAFGWKESLSAKISHEKGFYTVLTLSCIIGVFIVMSGMNPMKALVYSQVLSGILAPVLIIIILLLCNNTRVMGSFVNRWFDNVFGWLAAGVMIVSSFFFFKDIIVQ